MTISPLMVELFFPQLKRWTCDSSKLTSGTFLLSGRLGRLSRATSALGVDHQSKRRDMKIKSTFNISFQIRFVCFVLKIFIVSWILLVVAFNLLTPWCSFLQKGRLMKLCDGDCTIKKRNRQRCLLLKHFTGSEFQGARAYFETSKGNLFSLHSVAKCSLQFLSHYPAHCPYTQSIKLWTVDALLPWHLPVKTRRYTGFPRPADITGNASTREEGWLYVSHSTELSVSLRAH